MSEKVYIEKEAVVKNLKAECNVFNDDYDYELALDVINDMPPADVAPVVRGEWIEGEYVGEVGDELKWHCSSCRFAVLSDEYPVWHFCPSCGAEMRKEVNDER